MVVGVDGGVVLRVSGVGLWVQDWRTFARRVLGSQGNHRRAVYVVFTIHLHSLRYQMPYWKGARAAKEGQQPIHWRKKGSAQLRNWSLCVWDLGFLLEGQLMMSCLGEAWQPSTLSLQLISLYQIARRPLERPTDSGCCRYSSGAQRFET